MAAKKTVAINRAPVFTLWGSVVAERLGFDEDTALTLGRAVAALEKAKTEKEAAEKADDKKDVPVKTEAFQAAEKAQAAAKTALDAAAAEKVAAEVYNELRKAKVQFQMEFYSGAGHGFSVPKNKDEERASAQSIVSTDRFLKAAFAP